MGEMLDELQDKVKYINEMFETMQELNQQNTNLYKDLLVLKEENYQTLCNGIVACFQYILDGNIEAFEDLFKILVNIAMEGIEDDKEGVEV